ncbi:MAG: polysaccharide deacetylase family protein [Candidatus Hydrothermarchaeales archaeon]
MRVGILLLCLLLALGSVACISRPPKVEIANWPEGHKSAVCATFDTERASEEDLIAISSVLRNRGMNATFFVVSGYYHGDGEALAILKEFEVGNMAWNQSEWDESDLDYEYQYDRIKYSDEWLRGEGFNPRGFRAPFLKHNDETIRALKDLGYRYDSSKIGTLPFGEEVLEIPLAINYDPFWDPETMKYSIQPTYLILQDAYDEDGLFAFNTHPEKANENLAEFLEFIDYINGKNIWLPSCGEVAEWWSNKQALQMFTDKRGVIVKNNGNLVVEGATVKISPKREIKGAVSIVEEGDDLYAILPDIGPGSEAVLRIG